MTPTRFPAEPVDAKRLGEPLTFEFSGKTAKNRFLKAAMTERLSSWDAQNLEARGVPSRELINVYRRWGEGGYGLILTGNIQIEYDHLEAAGNPIIPPDAPFEGERFEAFKALATEAKREGSLIVGQISHPGRQVPESIQPRPISASDVQLEGIVIGSRFAKPRAMVKEDIDRVIEGFAHAAEYCYKAGFDGIELHGAHGYLLAQFLSLTTNKRTDQYGGSVENRARIIVEIVQAIRARIPNEAGFSLGIKVNSVEFQDGGFSPEECRDLCVQLEKNGFDYVELSGGTYQALAFLHKRDSSKKREGFFLEFAEMIIPQLKKTKAYVTGGLRTVDAMVKALDSVHGVGLGRPATHEFDFPKKVLEGKVPSAIETLLDERDFGSSNVAAGTQIKLVGKDKEPLDLSQERYFNIYQQSMGKWAEGMAQNADNSKYGFVDIEGTTLQPYGTPYSVA